MERFRMKPVTVEAVRWTGDNLDEVYELAGCENFDVLDEQDRANCDDPEATATVFARLHNSTWKLVYTGQWIVKGLQGEFFPLADDLFRGAYEDDVAAPGDAHTPADREADRIVRDILESLCRRDGLPLGSSVVPGEPARNYDLALRLGIGHVFGIGEPAPDFRALLRDNLIPEPALDDPPQPAPELAAALGDWPAILADVTQQRDDLRSQLDEIGVMAANAPEDGDSFGVLEEIAMRIAAVDIPDSAP